MEITIKIKTILEYLELFYHGYTDLSINRFYTPTKKDGALAYFFNSKGDEIRIFYTEWPLTILDERNGSEMFEYNDFIPETYGGNKK